MFEVDVKYVTEEMEEQEEQDQLGFGVLIYNMYSFFLCHLYIMQDMLKKYLGKA